MRVPFIKMHGAGNDFIMLDGIRNALPTDLVTFSQKICHRHFGVGADQVLIAREGTTGDFTMEIYNADGGKVEMCGNGIRCFIKYLHDIGLTQKNLITVDTLAGPIVPQIIENHPKTTADTIWVRVDMGIPELEGKKIPILQNGKMIDEPWRSSALDAEFRITCVSMGNPHCVIFVEDTENVPVAQIGSQIEKDAFFPNRVNVEFVTVKDRHHLVQRTWERGAGETYACGTGACAVAVAAVLGNRADRRMTISLKGGDLDLEWDEKTNHVFKTGPATTVFHGEWIAHE